MYRMNGELKALALRAIACPGWRWVPGMRVVICGKASTEADAVVLQALDGGLLMADAGGPDGGWYRMAAGPVREPALPVLTDPATLGCLRSLVERAWEALVWLSPGMREANYCTEELVVEEPVRWFVYRAADRNGLWVEHCGTGRTRADALVAALEAAPKREGVA